MKWKDMIFMALGSLIKHKARTLLTVSGVVIGTWSIVITISLGLGIKQTMDTMMQGMGDLTIININNYNHSSPDAKILNDDMLKKFKAIPNVVAVTPTYSVDPSALMIKSGKYSYEGMIYGVYMDALDDFGYKTEKGTLTEENAAENTILFGMDALYEFRNSKKKNNNMVNRQPDANGKIPDPYVDVLNDKLEICINLKEGSTKKVKPIKVKCCGILGEDWSKQPPPSYSVFMDVQFAKELVSQYNKLNGIKLDKNMKDSYDGACVKVAEIKDVESVEKEIKSNGFETNSMENFRKPMEEQTRTIQIILGSLGAITLLVAALGIANTMIMSISERTCEIGIMKVLGCVIGNIRTVFLMEAGNIGLLGGSMGLLLSYISSFIINSIAAKSAGDGGGFMQLFGPGSTVSVIPMWLAVGTLFFSTLIGLISGFYPANRAVKISALNAIKQE